MEKNKKLLLVVLIFTTLSCGTLVGLPATATPAAQDLSTATITSHSQEQATVDSTLALTSTAEVDTIPATAEIPLATNPECQNDYLPAVLGANWIYKHSQTTDQSGVTSSFVFIEVIEAMSYGFTTYVEHSNTTEFTPPTERIEKHSQFDPAAFYFPSELIETPSARYVYWACLDDGLGDHNAFMVDIPKEIPSDHTWTIDPSLGMNRDPNVYTSFGFETVTVPAGTFQAVKVKEEWSRVSAYHWYAPGIGKVKSYYSPEAIGVETVMELISYEIPTSAQPPVATCELNDLTSDQWNILNINLVAALSQFPNCVVSPIRIAVIDTGADLDHPDLVQNILPNSYSIIGGTAEDVHGHGTHVAGILASIHPQAELLIYKFSDDPSGAGMERANNIANLIRMAVENKAKVINISVGGPVDFDGIVPCVLSKSLAKEPRFCVGVMEKAVAYAMENNVMIVAASGNSGENGFQYPAAYTVLYDNVIAVAASTPNGELADYSTTGLWVTVAAPGGSGSACVEGVDDCVLSLGLNGKKDVEDQGTSQATPHVTGVVALVISANDKLTPFQIRNIIQATATRIETLPKERLLPKGFGIANAEVAIKAAIP